MGLKKFMPLLVLFPFILLSLKEDNKKISKIIKFEYKVKTLNTIDIEIIRDMSRFPYSSDIFEIYLPKFEKKYEKLKKIEIDFYDSFGL